jgi:tRNA pseudouridine38-40 synthase
VTYFRAIIEYDGTDYHGFQLQAGVPTIQEELEKATARITGQESRISGAGRTDAGVHATGQVIAFHADWRHPIEDLQRALNAVLPLAIVIKEIGEAADGFHPRFSAVSREYRYTILNQPWRSPMQARYAHHVVYPLDEARMNEAARELIGEHDFASFGLPPQGENTVRRVKRAYWSHQEVWYHFVIEADAFLRSMVRTVVGTLIGVGQGAISPDEFRNILLSRDRGRAAPPAPAGGLCLTRVTYG